MCVLPSEPKSSTPADGCGLALPRFAAIVLAGGAARRLGGADKPLVEIGGIPLLHRVVAAVAHADRIVVVGPERPAPSSTARVAWTREQPHGAGPAAAIAAGLRLVQEEQVVVVAADLPFLDRATVDRLRGAAIGHDGALLTDDRGREQVLVGAWSTAALRAAAERFGDLVDRSARDLFHGLGRAHLQVGSGSGTAPWIDCDTPDDLLRARANALKAASPITSAPGTTPRS